MSREQKFWTWFDEHREAFKTPDFDVVLEGVPLLRSIHDALAWEAGCGQDGVWELIISADGQKAAIPAVRALVASAPEIPGWRIVAFRQPSSGHEIRMGDKTLTFEDVHFQAYKDDGKIGLELFIKGFDGKDMQVVGMAFLLFDMAIGEFDAMTLIGGVGYAPFEKRPKENELYTLDDLAPIVASLKEDGYFAK
jgi:hypothetical protein